MVSRGRFWWRCCPIGSCECFNSPTRMSGSEIELRTWVPTTMSGYAKIFWKKDLKLYVVEGNSVPVVDYQLLFTEALEIGFIHGFKVLVQTKSCLRCNRNF